MRKWTTLGLGMISLALTACNNTPAVDSTHTQSVAPADPIVATAGANQITMSELTDPLIEGYGLNMLLGLVQRDLVRGALAEKQTVVTPADIDVETRLTLNALKTATHRLEHMGDPATQPSDDENMSQDELNRLLDQLLIQDHITRPQFNLQMEINAGLRKLAIPQAEAEVTDERVRVYFNAVYGEKAVVRYIVCRTMVDAQIALNEIRAGRPFEEVAKARSVAPRAADDGGRLPPFTRQDARYPQEFRDLVFSLKKGEVSDPLLLKDFIYLAKLEDLLPPQVAKFEDYRDVLKKTLLDQATQSAVVSMGQVLYQQAVQTVRVNNPVLQAQLNELTRRHDAQVHDLDSIRQKMDQAHQASTEPSTMPSTAPSSGPSTEPSTVVPTGASPDGAPPATKPATEPATP